MSLAVVDANIIAKLVADESDSNLAIDFLRGCVAEKVQVIAPMIIQYEVANIAIKKNISIDLVTNLFDENILNLVDLESPDRFTWLQAEKICQSGHEKSGYPSMYDSIYHAMAIMKGGTFFTADKRHYAKSKDFGHIALLEDWKETLSTL